MLPGAGCRVAGGAPLLRKQDLVPYPFGVLAKEPVVSAAEPYGFDFSSLPIPMFLSPSRSKQTTYEYYLTITTAML